MSPIVAAGGRQTGATFYIGDAMIAVFDDRGDGDRSVLRELARRC